MIQTSLTARVRWKRSGGFTLIELLVVIAIIGVLVGLLLPAVQQAREAARRSTCINNLKQMGVAFHNYHDARRAFPVGMNCSNKNGAIYTTEKVMGWSWAARLLPFLEELALSETLNIEQHCPRVHSHRGDLARRITSFLCPSDATAGGNRWRRFPPEEPPGTDDNDGLSNYVGNIGNNIWSDPWGVRCWSLDETSENLALFKAAHTGMLILAVPIRIVDVTDGTSKTIMVGERDYEDNFHGNHGGSLWAGVDQWVTMDTPKANGIVNKLLTFFDDAGTMVINAGSAGQNPMGAVHGEAVDSYSSKHPGGACFVLADGSTRFINEQIAPDTFRNLSKRSDGNPVGSY